MYFCGYFCLGEIRGTVNLKWSLLVFFFFSFPFQFMFYTLKLDAFKNDGLFLLFSGERPDFESILYWLFLLNLPARRRTL